MVSVVQLIKRAADTCPSVSTYLIREVNAISKTFLTSWQNLQNNQVIHSLLKLFGFAVKYLVADLFFRKIRLFFNI